MTELRAYRANEGLTAAWREHVTQRDQHIEQVVKPFVADHPNNAPMVDSRQNVIGFSDGDSKNPPPKGLSRSQNRTYLIPVRGKAGDEWRAWKEKLAFERTDRQVLLEFCLDSQLYTGSDGRHYLGRPNVVDFGVDGVFVYMGYELDPVPQAVSPVKLSVFYAAQERALERRQDGGAA